jgi:hypothetical protein
MTGGSFAGRGLLPQRLQGEPRLRMAAGARRRRREAQGRREGGRCRLRIRALDGAHGAGVSRSRFHGFDAHRSPWPRRKRTRAEAGVAERTTFTTARADEYPGTGYDLICFFDSLHDMGDPVAAAAHAAKRLAPDGTVMLVEPFANDRVEDNISPWRGSSTPPRPRSAARMRSPKAAAWCSARRRAKHGSPTCFARPASRAFRRAMATPFNLILEARL